MSYHRYQLTASRLCDVFFDWSSPNPLRTALIVVCYPQTIETLSYLYVILLGAEKRGRQLEFPDEKSLSLISGSRIRLGATYNKPEHTDAMWVLRLSNCRPSGNEVDRHGALQIQS